MAGQLVEVPTIDYSSLYYPDILKLLIQYRRQNAPEITDENQYEPYVQLERAFALVGHYSHVLLDVVANESLLPTAKLLESVRLQLRLIGYKLAQASPASVPVIYELSKVFTSTVQFVPQYSQSANEETEETPQIIYESDDDHTIDRTDQVSYVFSWAAAVVRVIDNVFDIGDSFKINTVTFVYGVDFVAGVTMADTAQNIADAVNTSTDTSIDGKILALVTGNQVNLVNLDDTTTMIMVENDGATDNLEVSDGTYSVNYAGQANTDAAPFTVFADPKVGDALYIAHKHIQQDKLTFVFDTPASGITGVWEYFDGELEDDTPNAVSNLGSKLRVDVSSLLPAGTDYSGTVVQVKLQETSVFENAISFYDSGVNYIETRGLLGQSSPSTTADDYVIGSLWQPLEDLIDGTGNMTIDEAVTYELPETLTSQWYKQTLNSLYNGYFLRYRIVSVSTPTSAAIDRIRIDDAAQYLKTDQTQGQFRTENPLGSSDGAKNQEFTLSFGPLIQGSLVVEIDEGTGFTAWSEKDNFLSSNNNSKDYTVDIKADDTVIIKFGDGIRGKIPAPGVDNVRVEYRTGADVDGNVGAETITVNKAGIGFVNRIWNPRQASGWVAKEGSTPEDLARVKIEGPASIRVLERGITTSDIEYLAENYTTSTGSKLISRAQAIEETFGPKTIELIVVGQGGNQLSVNERLEVERYFNGDKTLGIKGVLLANHEVTVVNYTKRVIDVTASTQGGNKTEIENALQNYLNPEAKYSDGTTSRWNFSTVDTTEYVRVALLFTVINEVDPVNIKNIVITTPAADVPLALRELPFPGNINVSVS